MTKILVLEKPEEKLRRERERLLGELSVYGERLAFLQDTVDEIKEMIEYYDGAIEALERLREKEIEYDKKNTKTIKEAFADMGKAFGGINFDEWYRKQKYDEDIYLLKGLLERDFEYLARDKDGVLSAYDGSPFKVEEYGYWDVRMNLDNETIPNDKFPEVQWTDDEPTKISKLLASYENGGESGN